MGDFGSATEAIRIIDFFALQIFAKNLDRRNFRLLQHYRPKPDVDDTRVAAFSAKARNGRFIVLDVEKGSTCVWPVQPLVLFSSVPCGWKRLQRLLPRDNYWTKRLR